MFPWIYCLTIVVKKPRTIDSINHLRRARARVCVCTCVCLCMCLCLYSSTVKASSDCKTTGTYFRGTDQRCYVKYHSRCFCQVPSSSFLKMSYISPPKTPKDENPSEHKLERKRYDIWFRENMIYIDIWYNKWRKHTKDEEVTLI